MRILMFGQTGVCQERVRQALHTYADNQQYARAIKWYCVEDWLHIQQGRYRPITTTVSPASEQALRRNWTDRFKDLLREIGNHGANVDVIISLHACFYRDHRFLAPADVRLLREFAPDMCVTLIDDIYDIWFRLFERYSDSRDNGYFRLD